MSDESDLLKLIKEQIKMNYYLEVEKAFLYGIELDMQTEGAFRREWESHHNFYCVDWHASKCKGPGRTIRGTVMPDLDVYICWRHLARRKRMDSRGPTIPPSG